MFLPPLNAARAQMGLDRVNGLGDLYSQCDLCIVAAPRELENESGEIPSTVCWVGPILEGPALITALAQPPDLGGERFMLISLGTSYQAQLPVLQRLVDAAGQLPGRVIVTTGPAFAPQDLKLPSNVTAVGYVPHDVLLPQAQLVVTHAGLGTVMAALRHGLPLLCLPLGRDQFANAAWVESMGAGRSLAADIDLASVAEAMRALLDPGASERAAAKRLAHIFDGYRGADAAAEALERLSAATDSA
jgi:MGT family glycosyltransferase